VLLSASRASKVYIGVHGIESDTPYRIPHLGVEKCGKESCRHVLERVGLLVPTASFHRLCYVVEMTFKTACTLVGKIPIPGSRRYTDS
jgi:hypothetical protein